ncbi:hypothetical protein PCC9214_00513 [Planktothrix tepida]|uniref:Uncharacterized protein n=2 Tax=Planktothrix TaxID=54304 RepID=A0A1J1LDX7_9CYAN|nr:MULTISPECIES: hypothetical protein [Planktothrix]CAD5918670.1 hypothetical protein PCC9214_00513 [Planktothrix tepida]CAD5984511.1 hypothetical protein NO713_05288 [Planktothrix pseudagardhii]CUR30803.1 conserved exported hypothetical protein [Planktothrix tepida PCC 9214]
MHFNGLKLGLRLFSSTVVAAGIGILGFTSVSFAQSTSVTPLQEFQRSDNPDPLSGSNSQKTMLDIIHNSRLGRFNVDYEAVGNQQRQNIQDAATQFRQKQRQLLENPQPSTPTEPSANPVNVQP